MYSISFEKFVLPNGMEVVFHEDHTLPTIGVNVWYHVGSKNEDPGRTGFAHLFEHVMFEGSKNHNHDYFEPLQKVGATLNGSTSADKTNYWENVPSNYLELALWLESDRMGFLLEALDQNRFDIQRDIVKNERRQSYENRPYGMAHLLLQPALFPTPHPYNWPVIGSQQDLDAAQLEDVKEFFKRFYSPSNASLALAGDFDTAQAKQLVELYFGDLQPSPQVSRVDRMASSITGEIRLEVRDRVQLPRLYLVWPSPPMFDVDEAPLDLLAELLGEGKTSRLYRSLVYDKQIARDVSVGNYAQEIAGEFQVVVTANPGHTVEELQEVVEEELLTIKSEAPDIKELQRSINLIEVNHVRQLENVGGFGGRADQLNHYNVFTGDPGTLNSDLDRYHAVKPDDITRVANQFLAGDRVHMVVEPELKTTSSKSSVDRSSTPLPTAERMFSPPLPKRHFLANGMEILFIQKQGIPLVSLGLLMKSGAVHDPSSGPGTAQITTTMLQEGTPSRTSGQISAEMEFIGSHLNTSCGREFATVSAEVLTPHWVTALEVMADITKNSQFPEREIARVQKQRIADIKRVGDDPASIASRAYRGLLFGAETPLGHPIDGTVSSVESLTRDDLITYHRYNHVPNRSTFVVVGPLDEDDLLKQVESLFGDWDGQGLPYSTPPKSPIEHPPSKVFVVDKPGAAQSIIKAGHITFGRSDPDFHAMTLINYIFGGHPSARLFANLRQDKGYSYGYYSSLEWGNDLSVISAGGAVETSVSKESIIETIKEFANIRSEKPILPAEYTAAHDGVSRGFPAQFETHSQIMAQLIRMAMFKLPDNYYEQYLKEVMSISLSELRTIAKNRILDQNLQILIVGDLNKINASLGELDLQVARVDYEGHLLS